MATGINALLGSYGAYGSSGLSGTSQLYDYKAAQQETQKLLNRYQQNNKAVNSLKNESANFLKQYTNSMNQLSKSSSALTGPNIDKLLYDKQGIASEDTIKATVKAVETMVGDYNDSLKMLNANADRGQGVVDQIARMADDPATKEAMEVLGVEVNKDASLSFDAEQLTKTLTDALNSSNPDSLKFYKDLISDGTGLARNIQKDAQAGLRAPAGKLIQNDLAEMRSIQDNDPIQEFFTYSRSGAFAMNNMAVTGMMMNMFA